MDMQFFGAQCRADIRLRLQPLEADDPDATGFSTECLPYDLDDGCAEDLGRAAQVSTHLESFHLDVTGVTLQGCGSLHDFFATSPRLTSVVLTGDVHNRDRKRQTLAVTNRLLAGIQRNASVRSVKLVGTHFHATALAHLLGDDDAAAPCRIRQLWLCDCWRGASAAMAAALARAIRGNAFLEEVTFEALNKSLTTALLKDGVTNHETIKRLNLDNLNPKTALAVRAVLVSSTPLETIGIYGSNLTEQSLGPIASGLLQSTTVCRLIVHGCRLDPAAVQQLKSLMRSDNLCALHNVDLSESISSDAKLAEITECLHDNRVITHLDIADCDFETLQSARCIRELLRRNHYLTHLDIDHNWLGSAGAEEIAAGLQHNTCLKHFDVSSCNLGDAGAMALMPAIINHPTLAHLYMCGNSITHEGIAFFLSHHGGKARRHAVQIGDCEF